MKCGCQQSFHVEEVEELESDEVFARFQCDGCGWTVGAEGPLKEIDPLVPPITWSDEARYHLSRLPPYLALWFVMKSRPLPVISTTGL